MDTTANDQQRWQVALEAARSGESPSFARALRRRNIVLWVVLVTTLVATGVIVSLIVLRFAPDSGPEREPSAWRSAVGFTLEGIGLVILLVNLVLLARRGRLSALWRSPTRVLSRSQRRSLLRQIRRKAPVDPVLLPLSRNLAAIMVEQQRQSPLLLSGLVLSQVGLLLVEGGTFELIFVICLVVLYVALIPYTVRQSGDAQRFLQDNPGA